MNKSLLPGNWRHVQMHTIILCIPTASNDTTVNNADETTGTECRRLIAI